MRIFNNLVSVIYTSIKFFIIKLLHPISFKYSLIERFSPNTSISLTRKAKIKLGKKVRVHSYSKIAAFDKGNLIIGDNVAINRGAGIYCKKNIIISDGTEIGPNVLIYDHDHDFRCTNGIKENKYTHGDVKIGKNVWIGANSVILKGTYIGDNSVVGANSVIKGDYPENSLIVQKRMTTVKKIERRKK